MFTNLTSDCPEHHPMKKSTNSINLNGLSHVKMLRTWQGSRPLWCRMCSTMVRPVAAETRARVLKAIENWAIAPTSTPNAKSKKHSGDTTDRHCHGRKVRFSCGRITPIFCTVFTMKPTAGAAHPLSPF